MPISNYTRLCFVVGDPTFQLRAPAALNLIARERGADVVTLPANVASGEIGAFLTGLRSLNNATGAVLTIPHKQDAASLCDELGPQASLSRTVNAIRRTPEGRLLGENFDGLGFVAGLRAETIEPEGMRVVLIGAGGAASAIAVALATAGARRITLINRTPERLHRLRTFLAGGFPTLEVVESSAPPSLADLIINTTPVGMRPGDGSPLAAELFPRGAIAADVIMSDALTPFLAAAAATGARTHEGTHMLHGQTRLLADFLGITESA